jgi:Predicted SAM-dependent methyltransferases
MNRSIARFLSAGSKRRGARGRRWAFPIPAASSSASPTDCRGWRLINLRTAYPSRSPAWDWSGGSRNWFRFWQNCSLRAAFMSATICLCAKKKACRRSKRAFTARFRRNLWSGNTTRICSFRSQTARRPGIFSISRKTVDG